MPDMLVKLYELDDDWQFVAGQKKEYLVHQMKDLRDNVRKNGRSGTMRAFIKKASDEDIELMAEYLSQIDRNKK